MKIQGPFSTFVLFCLFAGSSQAHAEKGHHPHRPYLAGVKGVAMTHVEHGETGSGAGAGMFLERALVEDLVDAELSVVYAHVEEEEVIPVDLLLKTPFIATHRLTVYAGAGGSLTYERFEEETHLRPGLAAQVGVYFWPWEHYGIDLELDYNFLLAPDIGHEINAALGPVMRF